MAVQIILKNSAVEGKNPTASQLAKGEIALNFHESGPYLTCEDSAGNVKRIAGVQQGSSQPSNPLEGAFWWKTDTDELYLYAEGSWTLVGGGGGGGGTVTDILGGDGIVVTDGSGPETTVDVDLAGGNDGLEFDGGKLSASVASNTVLGSVKVDNSTITANSDGVISAAAGVQYTGGDGIDINGSNVVSVDLAGGDDGLEIDGGKLKASTASASVLGSVKVDGTTITISSGVISASVSDPLKYKGTVDLTSATVISGLDNGDVGFTYANTGTGKVSSEWAAISSATTSTDANPGDLVIWKGTTDKFVYIPTGTPIPSASTPDLQDVTDQGNETTNDIVMTGTGSLKLPVGEDSERPSTPAAGMIRFTDQDLDPGTGTDPANFVEMYNGSNWVQMLDETTVGTSPDQVPANQMLGQMAFIDNVATLRPFTTPLASTLPVFVGECIVIWDDTNNKLIYRYRDTTTTYRQAELSFGAQVTG